MSWSDIRDALDLRSPDLIEETMTARDKADNPHLWLRDAIHDCTMDEIKRLALWAEDWLTCTAARESRADYRWQCMSDVYREAILALRNAGIATQLTTRNAQ